MTPPSNSVLATSHGVVPLPAFFPDGTRGVVRSVDGADLAATGTPGLVMNTFHLMTRPGAKLLKRFGGLHAFCGWNKPILTDSGGFQVYSLLRENPENGVVRPNGIIFRHNGEKEILTPEKCIRLQFNFGADVMMCLDWCGHPDDPPEVNRDSVDATIRWAEVCRGEYDRQLKQRRLPQERRPLLFGILQGANDLSERKRCADALLKLEFDGYGFGGWPLDGEGNLLTDVLAETARLMPDDRPKYALGVGKPENLVACANMGYNLFDTVIPTRDARHKRIYVFRENVPPSDGKFYDCLYMQDEKHAASQVPVSDVCDCLLCRNYSRGYLYHLFAIGDGLALRLATIHNLRFYAQLTEWLRGKESEVRMKSS